MKQLFRFKLEDGTVVTGANPVEALMNIKAETTGKTFDEKFKKEKKNIEKEQALVEFEKLYDGYIELEKNIGKKAVEGSVVVNQEIETNSEPEESDTTEPKIEDEEEILNKNEVVRIVQFQIRNPREVSTVDMENLLAKYPELVEKVKDIEKRRIKSLGQEKSNYDNDIIEMKKSTGNELIQQEDGTYITKSEEIKALYEKNKALINLRADEEIVEAKK